MNVAVRQIAKSVLPGYARTRLRQAYQTVEPLLYRGHNVVCPCCDHEMREFLPHGRPERRNARCAHCHSLERHRLLYLYLKQRTNVLTDSLRVLHFAPEYFFRNLFRGLPNLNYVTADIDPKLADTAMDITCIPVRGGSFDAVFCNHVLEHIPDDHQAMTELFRVLKPGGWAILQVPLDSARAETYENWSITAPGDREVHFGQFDHVRVYGRDYKDRLESAGFRVKVDDFVQQMGPQAAARYGLQDDEDIYFCTKP